MTAKQIRNTRRTALAAAAFGLALGAHGSAAAQSPGEFYKGKTVSLVVGHETGTGFDLYARTLARHYGRLLPGEPQVVVNNMPGASGLNAFNWLANIAPKDGTAMVIVAFTVPFEPLYGVKLARFDASKLQWIGNMDASVSVCAVATSTGIAKFSDLMERELLAGGTGRAGPLSQSPRILQRLTGAKFRVIEGYKGSASVKLAIERGEIGGLCGLSLSTVRTQYRDKFDNGSMRLIMQLGPARHPDLNDVPHVFEYAKTDEERQIFRLIFGPQGLGRSFVAPAETPPDRVAALRAAFTATMSDAKFREDAQKAKLDLRAETGEEVQKFIADIYTTPLSVVEKVKTILEK